MAGVKKSLTRCCEIENVGLVEYVKTKRAKSLRILLRPFKSVRVTVPFRVSYKEAECFFASRFSWVVENISKIRDFEKKHRELFVSNEPIDMKIARAVIVPEVGRLAERHGFEFGKVSVRRQKTRWGSCSANNNISLNAHLLSLPHELMEYVILHELVHTRVKDHSIRFWAEFEKVLPNAKRLDFKLKEYHLPLI